MSLKPISPFSVSFIQLIMLCTACENSPGNLEKDPAQVTTHTTFQQDFDFLQNHTDVLILKDPSGEGQIAVSGALQGRVMTSTANGSAGRSYGWINRALFESGETLEHMNAFGGEERFWLGPEGGQFSIFFKKGDPFDLEHWQTPALIDLEPFELIQQDQQNILFEKQASLSNYSGFNFKFNIQRKISILAREEINQSLGLENLIDIKGVGYRTINRLTNTGPQDWREETGLLSIWLLGMYHPSDSTVIVIPYEIGELQDLGPVINDTYFGKVPADRLVVKDGTIYFRGDGKYRSKIGLNPKRAKNICGAYDGVNKILTLVKYHKPPGDHRYVNSLWEIQDDPYSGDVVNSYNDGAPAPDKPPLGPFFELETSSPALTLKTGESVEHLQETYHFEGDEKNLDQITRLLLGVSLQEITAIF